MTTKRLGTLSANKMPGGEILKVSNNLQTNYRLLVGPRKPLSMEVLPC